MIVSFDEYKNKKKETEEYKISILKVIDDFIKWDEEFQKNHWSVEHFNKFKKSTDFYVDIQRRGDFVVNYMYNKFSFDQIAAFDEVSFTHKEYLRLIEFMKDPEVYKSSKKYNL